MSSDPDSQHAIEKVETPKRKRTKALALAGVVIVMAVALSVLGRGERGAISMVLQQIVTNSASEVTYRFTLSNKGWDCRMQPELFTKQPDGSFGLRALKFKGDDSLNVKTVRHGESVELNVHKNITDESYLSITCVKLNTTALGRRLAIWNAELRNKFNSIPLVFENDTTVALDLNKNLQGLK